MPVTLLAETVCHIERALPRGLAGRASTRASLSR